MLLRKTYKRNKTILILKLRKFCNFGVLFFRFILKRNKRKKERSGLKFMTLNSEVLNIRKLHRPKKEPLDKPAASWFGKDNIRGDIIDTLTIIFRTSGCYWGKQGGCTMCGYVYDSAFEIPTDEDILKQLDFAMSRADKKERIMVKIFTSGSFLDKSEISEYARNEILNRLYENEKVSYVLAETRPEFVTYEKALKCAEIMKDKPFEFAYGLETSNDFVRKNSINKGFSFEVFKRACKCSKKAGLYNKAYLLLKPPFLSEREAIEDMKKTIDDICEHNLAETVSMNLCNVQNKTFVEKMWERNEFRPPWLWSAVEILKYAKQKYPDLYIMSDPVGAGAKRGPRNCKECSFDVADMIRDFSITQDVKVLDRVNCDCKKTWEVVKSLDDFTFGSPIID